MRRCFDLLHILYLISLSVFFVFDSFVQSFNRPNLKFRVEPKKPSTLTADITKLIKEQFPGKCGIVYCLSRSVLVKFHIL